MDQSVNSGSPMHLWEYDYRVHEAVTKFPEWVDNEIYAYLRYYSLRSNTKGYGGKINLTNS